MCALNVLKLQARFRGGKGEQMIGIYIHIYMYMYVYVDTHAYISIYVQGNINT